MAKFKLFLEPRQKLMHNNNQPTTTATSKPENRSSLTSLFADFNKRNNSIRNRSKSNAQSSAGGDEKNWFKCTLNPFLREKKYVNESTFSLNCLKFSETNRNVGSCRNSHESEDFTIDLNLKHNSECSEPLDIHPTNTMKSCKSFTGIFQRRRKMANEDDDLVFDSNPVSMDVSLASSPKTPLGTSPSKSHYPFHPKPITAKAFDTQTIDMIQSTSFEEVLAFGFRKPTGTIDIPKNGSRDNNNLEFNDEYSQTIKLSLTPDKLRDFHSLAPNKEKIWPYGDN